MTNSNQQDKPAFTRKSIRRDMLDRYEYLMSNDQYNGSKYADEFAFLETTLSD